MYGGHVDPAHMYHMGGGQHLQSMTGPYGIPTGTAILSNGQGNCTFNGVYLLLFCLQ